jgi:hypothetical protein
MGIELENRFRVRGLEVTDSLSSVACLALFDAKLPASAPFPDGLNLQLVVRDPATNSTHGDVISVPTMRVPAPLFDSLLPSIGSYEDERGKTTIYSIEQADSIEQSDNVCLDGHNPLIFTVEGILAQKLGVADQLELGQLTFNAVLAAKGVGTSVYHEPVRRFEQIRMAGIVVEVTGGADLVPSTTASYSRILWVPVKDFLHAVETRNPAAVGLDPFKFCIHGLCIATTYDILAHRLGLRPFCDLSRAMATRT